MKARLPLSEVDGELYVKFTITGSPAGCGADVMSNGTYIRYQNYFRDNDVTNDPSVATRSQAGFRSRLNS